MELRVSQQFARLKDHRVNHDACQQAFVHLVSDQLIISLRVFQTSAPVELKLIRKHSDCTSSQVLVEAQACPLLTHDLYLTDNGLNRLAFPRGVGFERDTLKIIASRPMGDGLCVKIPTNNLLRLVPPGTS